MFKRLVTCMCEINPVARLASIVSVNRNILQYSFGVAGFSFQSFCLVEFTFKLLNNVCLCLQLVSLEKDMDKQWEEADDSLREIYGKDYLQQQHQITSQFASTTCNTLGPVVDSLEDAVVSTKPYLRYLVDGSNLPVDTHNVSIITDVNLTTYVIHTYRSNII